MSCIHMICCTSHITCTQLHVHSCMHTVGGFNYRMQMEADPETSCIQMAAGPEPFPTQSRERRLGVVTQGRGGEGRVVTW